VLAGEQAAMALMPELKKKLASKRAQ